MLFLKRCCYRMLLYISFNVTRLKKWCKTVNCIIKILCYSTQSRKLPVRGAETFGSYKSKHFSACASGISCLSRSIKATLTFSRLRTRHPSRIRVMYAQKLTPLVWLRTHSTGSTGHRVKYDCIGERTADGKNGDAGSRNIG